MTDLDAIRARADQDSIRELHAQDWECLLDLATQAYKDRNDLLTEVERLGATVERVEKLADEWERDHAKDDASSGGWFFATESAIEDLRAALRGEQS